MSQRNSNTPLDVSKQPKKPAPPIPTPRNASCSPLPGNANGITVRKQKTPRQTKSEDAAKVIKMNEEILRYRKNLQEGFKNSNNVNDNSQQKDADLMKVDEIQTLKKDLQDLLEKNTQWQVYNEQREDYVRSLHEKYNTLQHQCHHMHERIASLTDNPNQLSEQQRKYYDGLLVEARQHLQVSRDEATKWKQELEIASKKFEDEKLKLRRELEHWRVKYDRERNANMSLQKEMERHKKQNYDSYNKENLDEISILKMEMGKCREDFKLERQRREDIERRLNGLQRKFRDSEISSQKKRSDHLMEYERDRTYIPNTSHDAARNCHVSPPKVKKITISHEKSQSRMHKERKSYPAEPLPYSSRHERPHKERSTTKREDRTGKLKQNKKLNQTYSEFGHHHAAEELKCPNCGKVYGVEEHEFLLIHIDSCV
uniref:centrosomal protein of 55 kDa-like n=1 Tax=Styela clava TaxID=7725 RepID=UPI0019394BF6|nr:centrosomal protein of 55 kDa-like [Styela clava]